MRAFILTWNPTKWSWGDDQYMKDVAATSSDTLVAAHWSVGVRRSGIEPGDRAFLLRQRVDRGIVASGTFTSEIHLGSHFDGSGRPLWQADLDWDTIVACQDRLGIDDLKRSVPEVKWDRIQGSGVEVPEGCVEPLCDLWSEWTGRRQSPNLRRPAESARREVQMLPATWLPLKTLTIHQPWASLIMAGVKDIENRSWSTSFRGQLGIHAGQAVDEDGLHDHKDLLRGDLPRGALIGRVTLTDCVRSSRSKWAHPGMWHWVLTNPEALKTPISMPGRQGLWYVRDDRSPQRRVRR